MYSILIRATFLVIVEDRMLNAKDVAKKLRTSTSVQNSLEVDILINTNEDRIVDTII